MEILADKTLTKGEEKRIGDRQKSLEETRMTATPKTGGKMPGAPRIPSHTRAKSHQPRAIDATTRIVPATHAAIQILTVAMSVVVTVGTSSLPELKDVVRSIERMTGARMTAVFTTPAADTMDRIRIAAIQVIANETGQINSQEVLTSVPNDIFLEIGEIEAKDELKFRKSHASQNCMFRLNASDLHPTKHHITLRD